MLMWKIVGTSKFQFYIYILIIIIILTDSRIIFELGCWYIFVVGLAWVGLHCNLGFSVNWLGRWLMSIQAWLFGFKRK